MTKPRVIAALGSSFAAGPGLPPYADASAMRSQDNYAHRFAAAVGARLVDLTVSGATTSNVLDTPQQVLDGTTYPPQLDGVPPDADVVTITAGGNDLQFAGALLFVALQRQDPSSAFLAMRSAMFPAGVPEPDDHVVSRATEGLVRVVEEMRRRVPSAWIVLVDYLTVVEGADAAQTPFTDDELARFVVIEQAIGRVFADAAAATGADLLAASALSRGHALGSPEPWVQPFSAEPGLILGSFHPNRAGMGAVAEELLRRQPHRG